MCGNTGLGWWAHLSLNCMGSSSMQGVLTRVRGISFRRVCIIPDVLALLGFLRGSMYKNNRPFCF